MTVGFSASLSRLTQSAATVALLLSLAMPAHAFIDDVPDSGADAEAFFGAENKVSDEELSGMRGAYIDANGLEVNFTLTTQTIIDGRVVHEVRLTPQVTPTFNVNDLSKLVRVGEGNIAYPQELLNDANRIMTVIQNTNDNTVIQNLNLLDLEVDNVQDFYNQQMTGMVNFSAVRALR